MKKFKSVGMALCLILSLAGCRKEKFDVTLQFKKASYELTVDNSIDLVNEIKVENSELLPGFSSSDATIVEVTPEGVATAVSAGEAVITAELEGKKAVTTIKVKAVAASKIELTYPQTLEAGEKWGTIRAAVTPENYDLDSLSWSFTPTSDQLGFEYEKVNAAEYKVRFKTFKNGGSVLVKVNDRNSNVSSTASIAVTGEGGEAVGAKRITLDYPSSLTEGEGNWGTVTASVQPEEYDMNNLDWEFTPNSADLGFKYEKVSAEEYRISFQKYIEGGKVDVKVTDLITESFQVAEIKVEKKPETGVMEISVTPTALELFLGMDSGVLTVKCSPENYDKVLLEWTSSDEEVAVVSEGNVTAVAEGKAVITVKDKISGKKAESTVTVKEPVTDAVIKEIRLSNIENNMLNMRVGDGTFQLIAECYDEDGNLVSNYAGLEWVADKAMTELVEMDVVEISQNGLVTPLLAGSTLITVFDKRNPAIKATCNVVVAPAEVKVKEIYLNPSSKSIEKDEQFKIHADFVPSNAENKTLSFVSSAPTVATVDAEGNVTGVAYGETVITVTAASGVTAQCRVSVVKVDVVSVTLNIAEDVLEMVEGGTRDVSAVINPVNASVKTVTWSSSNTGAVTVLANGNDATIKAVAEGESVVKAEADGKSVTVAVKVKKPVEVEPTQTVESIEFNPASETMHKGDTKQLKYTVTPANAAVNDLKWNSSNTAIAAVSSTGIVTANAVGEADITLIVNESKTAVCKITVEGVEPTNIYLSSTSIKLSVGEKFTDYSVNFNPGCDYKEVIYTSSDPSVASVDEKTGEIKAVKIGKADITVTSKRNSTLKAVLKVEVTAPEDFNINLSIDANGSKLGSDYNYITSFGLPQTDQVQLNYSFTNGYTPAQLTWTSSDQSIATVDKNGLVTAVWNEMMDLGERKPVVIRLEAGGKYESVSLKVVKARPQSIKITSVPTNNKMYVGEEFTFQAEVQPALAGFGSGSISWMCSAYGEIGYETGIFHPKTPGVKSIEAIAREYVYSNEGVEPSAVRTSIQIAVEPVPFTATISPSSMEIEKGKSAKLVVTFDPADNEYCDYSIDWSSSNTAVATVSGGTVTGVSVGNARITAELSDGTTLSADIKVVEPAPENPKVGDYYYNDGTYSSSLVSGKTPIGVIFSVNNPTQQGDDALAADHKGCVHGFVVSLNEVKNKWQEGFGLERVSDWAVTNNMQDLYDQGHMCGYSNTKTIKAYMASDEYKNLVSGNADYKISLFDGWNETAPDNTTGWYVPSIAELGIIYDNKTVIDSKISSAGGTVLNGTYNCEYWSTTETSLTKQAGLIKMNNGNKTWNGKENSFHVRYILAF